MFIRSANNYVKADVSKETASRFRKGFGKAVQSEKDTVDLNLIMKRFGVTGVLPQGRRIPQYGDFTGVVDFQTGLNAVRKAQESFDELPGAVRARFGNDPQRFLEFCTLRDEEGKLVHLEELRKLGFANPEEVPEPEKVLTVRLEDDKITPDDSSDGPKDKKKE